MPTTILQDIQTKVRRLTRSPSESLLTTDQLNQYINTFVLYDLPEHLRLFNLRKTFTFITNPFQDAYPTDTISFVGVDTNPLYDFQNRYLTIHPPVYIAGFNSMYTQSREQFYGIYPDVNSIASIGTAGNGITTTFTGVVNTQQAIIPSGLVQQIVLLQNNVLFSSVDSDGNGLALQDVPVVSTVTGNPTVIGNLYEPSNIPSTPPTAVDPNNNINYITGAFTITFMLGNSPTAPGQGVPINSQTVPQQPTLPQALLFYDDTFFLRPVPDQPYRVQFEVYIKPSELLDTNPTPELKEWWQYIAYGAAKKVFEDRMDTDSVGQLLPEFKKQEALIQRRTIVQYTNERVATIYTEQSSFGPGSGSWGWGGGNF